jgi:hypothetical protein
MRDLASRVSPVGEESLPRLMWSAIGIASYGC